MVGKMKGIKEGGGRVLVIGRTDGKCVKGMEDVM